MYIIIIIIMYTSYVRKCVCVYNICVPTRTREVFELLMQNYVKRKMSYFDYLHVEVHFQFTRVLYKYIYIHVYGL